MPADKPAPEAAPPSAASRSRTVAAGTRAPRATAAVPQAADGEAPAVKKKAPAKTVAAVKAAPRAAARGTRAKPTIAPSPGTGEGGERWL